MYAVSISLAHLFIIRGGVVGPSKSRAMCEDARAMALIRSLRSSFEREGGREFVAFVQTWLGRYIVYVVDRSMDTREIISPSRRRQKVGGAKHRKA